MLWRAGLRIGEALDLAEADLDPGRGALLVRRGKGGKRRETGMDDWGWQQLRPGSPHRTSAAARAAVLRHLRRHPRQPLGRQRRPRQPPPPRRPSRRAAPLAPHQLRHAHAIEMAQAGVALNIIQRQLGHTDLGVTSIYLQGIDNTEIINTIHARRPPMMPASGGLKL